MKQKTLWIIAAFLYGLAYTLFQLFPLQEYSVDRRIWWLINTCVMLIFTGSIIFPITSVVALFLPKNLSYPDRFRAALPTVVILVAVFMIYTIASVG